MWWRLFKILAIVLVVIILVAKASSVLLRQTMATIYSESMQLAPFDVVIVPGIPYDSANPNIMLKARMFWAKNLFEKVHTRHIIFSGNAVHSPYIDGQCLKITADSLGIPTARTYVELRALHGTENIDLGIAMAKQLGFKNIAIATDPFQTAYLKYYEKKNNAPYLPMPVDSIKAYDKSLPAINTCELKVENFVPLKECEKNSEY